MNFLKNCFTALLCNIILSLLLLLVLVKGAQNTILQPDGVHGVVDSISIKEQGPPLAKEFLSQQISSFPEEEAGGEIPDFDKTIDEAFASLTEEDEELIKSTIHDAIDEFYAYLNSETEQLNIVISTEPFRPILLKSLVSSDELMGGFDLPFELCSETVTENCVDINDFTAIFDQALSGELDPENILQILPTCPEGYIPEAKNGVPECLPQGDYEKYLEQIEEELVLGAEIEAETPLPEGGIPETIEITDDMLPEEFEIAREVVTRIKLVPYILLLSILLLSLMISLIQGVKSLRWVGGTFTLAGALTLVSAFASSYGIEFGRGELTNVLPSPVLVTTVINIIQVFTDFLNRTLIIWGGSYLVLGLLMIAFYLIFRKKEDEGSKIKEEGEKRNVVNS